MFGFCSDPALLAGTKWFACYLTTGKQFSFYLSFITIIVLLLATAPVAMLFGFAAAFAKRSRFSPLRWLANIYTSMIRGVPDIVFFLFVPVALDQLFEYLRHASLCPDDGRSVWQGNDFIVCPAAKLPLSASPEWVHDLYGVMMAILAFAIVFGAFAANVIYGALAAVPKGQIEAASALGMRSGQTMRLVILPQMWVYALPGLSNLWMVLIKVTPLLFLLGVEDAVYWAKELGGSKNSTYAYPHADWRIWYFVVLLLYYLFLTWASQNVLARIARRAGRGIVAAATPGARA